MKEKYKFAHIEISVDGDVQAVLVALQSQESLGIQDGSPEDERIYHYYDSLEELMEQYTSSSDNYDETITDILVLYDDIPDFPKIDNSEKTYKAKVTIELIADEEAVATSSDEAKRIIDGRVMRKFDNFDIPVNRVSVCITDVKI